MPSLKTEVPHTLGQDAALEKLKSFLDGIGQQYQDQVEDLQGEWTANCLNYSFAVFGMEIRGTLTVLHESAQVVAQVPFAALAFRGRIEQQMRTELVRILS